MGIYNLQFQAIDPAQLAADLGGNWHRHYGIAPCPVCQPERRRDQGIVTLTRRSVQ